MAITTAQAIANYPILLEEIEKINKELRALRRWKAEAVIVLQRWDEVADLVPENHVTIGSHKSYNVSRYIEWIQNENQTLKHDIDFYRANYTGDEL